MKVFYLGPEGSFSHSLVQKVFFDERFELIPLDSFREVIQKTVETKESVGVLAVENSITSSVHDNIDSIFQNDLKIVGEAELKINLHLFGQKGLKVEDIKQVYSHAKAFSQCNDFVFKNNLEIVETNSTSAAKRIVVSQDNPEIGFIGGFDLLDDSVEIIKEDISDEKFNLTRFVFVSQDNVQLFNIEKTKKMIKFHLKHESGSLAKVLTKLSEVGINLTKIESRPIPGTEWEYSFLIEFEGGDIDMVTSVLDEVTSRYWVIGEYPKFGKFES